MKSFALAAAWMLMLTSSLSLGLGLAVSPQQQHVSASSAGISTADTIVVIGTGRQQNHLKLQSPRTLQSSALRVDAVMYECDVNNERIEDDGDSQNNKKKIGQFIKYCIQPSLVTQNRDVFLRSIESLMFVRNLPSQSVRQVLVENRVEQEATTLAVCIPGSVLCTVQTRLDGALFVGNSGQNVQVSVIADIALQFGTLNTLWGDNVVSKPGKRALVDGGDRGELGGEVHDDVRVIMDDTHTNTNIDNDSNNNHRDLQLVGGNGNYAGSSEVRLFFNISTTNFRESDPNEEDESDDEHWWKDSPVWQRLLVVVAFIITFCVFCCCFAACCFWMREEVLYKNEGKDGTSTSTSNKNKGGDEYHDEHGEEDSFMNGSRAGTEYYREEQYDDRGNDDGDDRSQSSRTSYDSRQSRQSRQSRRSRQSHQSGRSYRTNSTANHNNDEEPSETDYTDSSFGDEEGQGQGYSAGDGSRMTLSEPSDDDICLMDMDHPGTQDFDSIMRQMLQKYPKSVKENDSEMNDKMLKFVKKQCRGRDFYVESGSGGEWRKVSTRSELTALLNEYYVEYKEEVYA
eukprot:CAMPEP_0119546638 /NCGR_PEP_ID=MMETSP1352-20130426/967_1 /TAXON_ID=265584 /ORGANISM="Stauroneis constricta, Strain CCMP1120" /LENGTH=569 /DNA_ID=CAMNT_0007591359 /DNA_START=146 /DNA_END=1855 /DNA_ORIENTATION=+